MNKLIRLLAAVGLSAGLVLPGMAIAQAGTQSIDCTAHVLDATVQQGIYKPSIVRQVDMLLQPVPTADVYVQAYEQLPGGSPAAFWALGQQQCTNWRDASGKRAKDNVLVVVYGRDIDDVGVFSGNDFEIANGYYVDSILNGMRANLGPKLSQMNPNYVTEALADAVRATEFHVRMSLYFNEADGLYHPPVYVDSNSFYEKSDPRVVAGMVLGVAAGFTVVGLVLQGIAVVLKRRRDQRPVPLRD